MNAFARRLFAVAAAFFYVGELAATERLEVRTFVATPDAALNVTAHRGFIVVDSSDDPVIRIEVAASTALENERAGERLLQQMKFEWKHDGAVVSLHVTNPRESRVQVLVGEEQNVELVIKVTVPRGCHVDLATGGGNLRVGDIRGDVRLQTAAGTISCRGVEGSIVARNKDGDIVVSRCSGNVDLASVRGDVRTGTIGGYATLAAVSGNIEINSAGRGLVATTNGGDVTAGIPREFSGKASVRSSGGNVKLNIDPAAQVRIEASASWGRIRKDEEARLPLEIESGGLGKRSLSGKVNGGGPVIEARASGGHVELSGEAPPFS